jgi:hypothetical protein
MSAVKACTECKETGGILIIFAVFIGMMVMLLTLAIDGYFRLQARLEEQNLAEYLSMAALSGFEEDPDADYETKRVNALQALQSIQASNTILATENNHWNFNGATCSGPECSGTGWRLSFGQWVEAQGEGDFIPAQSISDDDPDLVDDSDISAVYFELDLPIDTISKFFINEDQRGGEEGSSSMRVSSVVHRVEEANQGYFRSAKITAKGKAF